MLENNAELRRSLDMEVELYRGMTGAEGYRSIVFFSRRVVEGLGDIRQIFMGATFYTRPNIPESCQVFTMVTVRDSHVCKFLLLLDVSLNVMS